MSDLLSIKIYLSGRSILGLLRSGLLFDVFCAIVVLFAEGKEGAGFF